MNWNMNPAPIGHRRSHGYTLLELMIVVMVIGIMAAIALPAYTRYITKSRRAAAEACLSMYAEYMERFYTTNLRYDQDTTGKALDSTALAALNLSCAATTATGPYYTYSFSAASTQNTYSLQAVPSGRQATNDAQCGTLTIDQTGKRQISGTADLNTCWQH